MDKVCPSCRSYVRPPTGRGPGRHAGAEEGGGGLQSGVIKTNTRAGDFPGAENRYVKLLAEEGYDPASWLDRSIQATRTASFPLNGLDPQP